MTTTARIQRPFRRTFLFVLASLIFFGLVAQVRNTRASFSLLYFTATPQSNQIVLAWETGAEVGTVAFGVHRAISVEDLSGPPIAYVIARGGVTGASYSYSDQDIQIGVLYYYQLEEVTSDGRLGDKSPIVAAGIGIPTLTPTPTTTPTTTSTPTTIPTTTSTPTITPTATRLSPPFSDCSPANQPQIPQPECEALVALYNSANGLGWSRNDGWLTTGAPCNWYGVGCGAGHVRYLNLSSNQLSGAIPPALGNLANLGDLDLSSNQLSGAIPAELGNLANLEWLNLSSNQLSGAIPPALGNLANLEWLNLSSNQLSGAIPPALGNLANLQFLDLYSNQLSGAIPPELGNLASLQRLYLFSNRLTGAIPPELCNLTNLQGLALDSNQLSGAIPPALGNLANLQTLSLVSNQLSGAIPPALGSLANLQTLYLGSNQLSGAIPPALGNLANLQGLHLYSNQLSGAIPPALGNLANLQFLDLYSNQLSGAIPPALGNLANLQALVLWSNQLSGTIPPALGHLANLEGLYLSSNQLSGAIPPALGNLTNLRWLILDHNQLSGAIPPALGHLANLQQLALFSNQLSGALPHSLMNLQLNLFHFDDTDLCEPPDAAFQAWLASILDLRRTGAVCRYAHTYLPVVLKAEPPDSFWADRYRLAPGECTTLHWSVTNAQAVYLDDMPVVGQDARQVCPVATRMYVLRVERGGRSHDLRLTIIVEDGTQPDMTLWHGWIGAEADALAEVVSAFQAANPGVALETLAVPFDQLKNKYTTEASTGGGPDLLIGPKDWIGELAQAGVIAPLDDLAGQIGLNNLNPSAVDGNRFQGKVWALPESTEVVALWYNKDLVKEAPKSGADLLTQAAEVGLAYNSGFYHSAGILLAEDGRVFDDQQKCAFAEGDSVANGLTFIMDAAGTANVIVDGDYGKLEAAFKDGNVGFIINGPWATGDYVKALGADKLGIAEPITVGAGKFAPFLGTKNVFLSANSKSSSAIDFLQFMSEATTQAMLTRAGHIPSNPNAQVDDPFIAAFMKQAASASYFPNEPEMGAVWTPAGDMIIKVIEGKAEPADAVAEACRIIDAANHK